MIQNKVILRPLKTSSPSDLKALAPLVRELLIFESQYDSDHVAHNANRLKDAVDAIVANAVSGKRERNGEVVVAETTGADGSPQMVGFVVLEPRLKNGPMTTRPVPAMYVAYLMTTAKFRRQGVATKLMRQAANFAKAAGVGFVTLTAYSENPVATAFYARWMRPYETTWISDVPLNEIADN